ncbi:MAG: hypothetical protein C4617_04805 [Candidatus Liberibacter europaeus]|uniref:Uncharacterized protein n=1 Tax=Candidatus Liberibacter europaeus TaxID=744859 RepID=A0A2T4VWN7_9HYPH|nr:hypothetical protein [Candidatus Liberibacter europaeus]PTL86192.1 MAG: hypothetical protein C4617_04805 [Candidatus Liberibacter europaeus]
MIKVEEVAEILRKMKANPKGNWRLEDVKKVCEVTTLKMSPPKRGSHYKVSSPYLRNHLTIPYAKPIHKIYIKAFVNLCNAHLECAHRANGEKKRLRR